MPKNGDDNRTPLGRIAAKAHDLVVAKVLAGQDASKEKEAAKKAGLAYLKELHEYYPCVTVDDDGWSVRTSSKQYAMRVDR